MVLILLLLLGFLGLRFGSALFQEDRPFLTLYSVMKLELSNQIFEQVIETSENKIYVSKTSAFSQEIFQEFMAEKDWQFKEQMGSGFFCEKDGLSAVVTTRMYTKHYFLWTVPKEVQN